MMNWGQTLIVCISGPKLIFGTIVKWQTGKKATYSSKFMCIMPKYETFWGREVEGSHLEEREHKMKYFVCVCV